MPLRIRTFCAVLAVSACAGARAAAVRDPYVGAIAVVADTGEVLRADCADGLAYPASVTKLMTALLVLDDVAAGKFSLDDMVVASPTRTKADVHYRQPSCIGIPPGAALPVDDMLKALLVHSANDAAIYLAEKCSGSVDEFVARMNARAAELGMKNTRYCNPNGLPPPAWAKERRFNTSTCRDQAVLAREILAKRPEMLKYTSLKTCEIALPRGKVKFVNHNNVMVKNKLKVLNPDGTEAVDGMKTGFIKAGGSSVVLTGSRGGHRVVVVVLGSPSAAIRDAAARNLMEEALGALSWRGAPRRGR